MKEIFTGWIQDVNLFLAALTHREIHIFHNGSSYENIRIQPECRCPDDYPVNENKFSTNCLPYTIDSSTKVKNITYLNTYAHPLEFINDGDFLTTWVSEFSPLIDKKSFQPLSIVINLQNGVYILHRIEVYFQSFPARSILIERFYDDEWTKLSNYSLSCKTNDTTCLSLPR